MAGRIILEAEHQVSRIVIHNPERRNAFSTAMEAELRRAFEDACADTQTKVIVLTGSGTSFCVGGDMEAMAAENDDTRFPSPIAPASERIEEAYTRRFSYILGLSKPVIAGINGSAAGIGAMLPLFCDIRYMVDRAKYALPFSKLGLVAEQGSAWLLPRLIGPMNALDLLLTGRTITGIEAAALGLVRALPSDGFSEVIMKMAQSLASSVSPRSTAIIRRQVYDSLGQGLAESYYRGEIQEVASANSEDSKEGLAALMEKRAPSFTGR